MLVKSHLKHVFTQFRKVLDFRSGFIGLWLYSGQAPFLNELIKANQRTKFHFFSIIIDLESPEIITSSGLIEIEKKNQRLVRKSRFLTYLVNI